MQTIPADFVYFVSEILASAGNCLKTGVTI